MPGGPPRSADSKDRLKAPGDRIDHYRIRVDYADLTTLTPELYTADAARRRGWTSR